MRRAFTEDELGRLLKAARLRPVAEYGRETVSLPPEEKEGRSTWRYKELTYDTLEAAYERGQKALEGSPDYLAKRERLGLERMLIYRTMVLTGLRLGELASITVGRLHLDSRQPHAELLAKDAKTGQRALIPLREHLVDDLRDWLDGKLEALREQVEEDGVPLPLNLPVHEPLFAAPRNLIKSFNLDSPYGERPTSRRRTSAAGRSTSTRSATPSGRT
ncbi:MAG: tyrosine-type recombinase/integrase [Candidatus Brocadiia bacterium]